MRFRTEIERLKAPFAIEYTTPLLFLGSCFSDEIGSRLADDGFCVLHNPMGPLYNPASIANCLDFACSDRLYTGNGLSEGPRGYHCLDYSTRYSGADASVVLDAVNRDIAAISDFLVQSPVVFITLGSAFVYRTPAGRIAGNCHKFPADYFSRELLTVEQAAGELSRAVELLASRGIERIVFTVSPIRHLADGLHGNNISKATLLLAVNQVVNLYGSLCSYFPSYEIVLDDLRDYRFYAEDLKHPSPMAVDYIYEIFSDCYFSSKTRQAAAEGRKATLAARHRPIL